MCFSSAELFGRGGGEVGGEGIGPTSRKSAEGVQNPAAALGEGESGDGGWTTRKAAK